MDHLGVTNSTLALWLSLSSSARIQLAVHQVSWAPFYRETWQSPLDQHQWLLGRTFSISNCTAAILQVRSLLGFTSANWSPWTGAVVLELHCNCKVTLKLAQAVTHRRLQWSLKEKESVDLSCSVASCCKYSSAKIRRSELQMKCHVSSGGSSSPSVLPCPSSHLCCIRCRG